MCYSAMAESDLRAYLRKLNARIDYEAFERLMAERMEDEKLKVPRALELSLRNSPGQPRLAELIDAYRARRAKDLQAELFKQKRRLADAGRALAEKPTKAAADSQRIAGTKIEWALGKLAELNRPELTDEDSRIFPYWYAPVIVAEGNELVVRPMRYHCRPAGKPAFYDRKYPGCFNARRDNLEGFWNGQFGRTHAVFLMHGFYENVARHDFEGRELAAGEKAENVILNFRPQTGQPMLAAAIWSRWTGEGAGADDPALDSFALITDEPPPEVAAAGHDRCPIPLKPGNLQAWLHPEGASVEKLYALLDDRERPYYEHRLAA